MAKLLKSGHYADEIMAMKREEVQSEKA